MSGSNEVLEGEDNLESKEPENSHEPVDIAEAFRMLNQSQREAAQDPVEDGEGSGDEPGEPADSGDGAEGGEVEEADDDQDDLGGSTDVVEPVDLNPQKQAYLKNIQDEAMSNVSKKMQEDQIELWGMDDIYERDENTGRVTFNNPDDPNRPFQSRAEAQAWIEAMNKEVTNYFRKEVNKEQQRLVQQRAPIIQMFDFAPVYQGMSSIEQDVFNDLIEPYAIKDNSGKAIGFNVNLRSVANTARQIAKRFQEQSAAGASDQPAGKPQAKKREASKPAMDMKSGASGDPADDEPKTLGEALKMYDAQQREANKKGK